PPRISTRECSCRLCPTPGMYVVTSMPFVRRTRATLRSAEFGFFGVCVKTRTHTPRFCGLSCRAGLFVLLTICFLPARTSWLIVGINKQSRQAASAQHRGPNKVRSVNRNRFRPKSYAGLAPENPITLGSSCCDGRGPSNETKQNKLDRVS